MKCNPSLRHRYEDCPAGYCCVRDEFLPTFVYCRKYGDKDDNCTTKETQSECPCAEGLKCLANIQGKYPSVYGRCVVNATTPATTATTATPVAMNTTEPIAVNNTTVADQITSEDVNTTFSMVSQDANVTADMITTDDDVTMMEDLTTEMPASNATIDSSLNSTDSSTMET
ncbi:hypothetical protein ElyMa_004688100 [Elysia marginata]|uniref:EB domain-containing protein n=1 Tax=Elysia marginata TaxID=1093978 RepID=A0AAV4I9N3_9GAST|nr:hypothetical protein ElyMa_004688100 [Elysia marginata]